MAAALPSLPATQATIAAPLPGIHAALDPVAGAATHAEDGRDGGRHRLSICLPCSSGSKKRGSRRTIRWKPSAPSPSATYEAIIAEGPLRDGRRAVDGRSIGTP